MKAGELNIENYRTFNRLVRNEMERVSIEVAQKLEAESGAKYYSYLVGIRNKLKSKIKAK